MRGRIARDLPRSAPPDRPRRGGRRRALRSGSRVDPRLAGDSADGFPGIPGWGEKSAAAVLARHLHLEAIPDEPSRWGVEVRSKDRLAAALRERREEAMLYRRLATLRTDVPLAEELADLEWRGARRADLEPLCHEIGAPELVERVRRWRAD